MDISAVEEWHGYGEQDDPVFHVSIFSPDGQSEFQLSNTDVLEVLEWVKRTVEPRDRFALGLLVQPQPGLAEETSTIHWILGTDLYTPATSAAERRAHARMDQLRGGQFNVE